MDATFTCACLHMQGHVLQNMDYSACFPACQWKDRCGKENDDTCLPVVVAPPLPTPPRSQYSKSNQKSFFLVVVVYYSSQLSNAACSSRTAGNGSGVFFPRVRACCSPVTFTSTYARSHLFVMAAGVLTSTQRLMVTYLLIGAFPESTLLPPPPAPNPARPPHQRC